MASSGRYQDDMIDGVKGWIDDRVSATGSSIYNNGTQLLASGFGKGLLTAAALCAGGILIGAVLAPELVLGSSFFASSLPQILEGAAMKIGNTLLGSWAGAAILAGGGAVGSLVAAHQENARISKEAAEHHAICYQRAREANAHAPERLQEQEPCMQGGHCARLMQEQQQQQQQPEARGLA